ncbi:MAG: M15 family metallopeptidase [Anaeromyxobacteraceae bacterium]
MRRTPLLALALAALSAFAGAGPALAAAGPAPARGHDLVDVAARIPDALVELRYATPRNFLGRAVYPAGARCLLRAPVADRLARAAARLRPDGLRLRLWDCFRPVAVQREMWRLVPRPGYVADPAKGSNHNRGAAVDVGLAGADGAEVPVPTDFDTFSPRAHARAAGLPEAAARNRDRLRAAMEAEGFRVNRMEWWHFDAPEARGAPLLDAELR